VPLARAAHQPHGVREAARPDPPPDLRAVRAVVANDGRLDGDALRADERARLDEDVEALLRYHPANAERTDRRAGRGGTARCRGQQPREIGVQPMVHAVHGDAVGDPRQVPSVRLGAGHGEARGADLAAEKAAGIERRLVEIARVRREREGDAADHGGQPGHRRRPVAEVRVQVTDVGGAPQAVGERGRLEKLLDDPRGP